MLKFSGIQPVQFGGRDCAPTTLSTELKLRVERASFETEEQEKRADEVLASCFPDDEAYVLDFLQTKMTATDKRFLQAYLTGGEKAIAILEDTIKTGIARRMESVE